MNTNYLDGATLKVLVSKFEVHIKSWLRERLNKERQINSWDVDQLKQELALVMQQEVTSFRDSLNAYADSWEHGDSVLKDTTASDLGERLMEAERELTRLQKENGAMEELKRRLAKMEEDRAREKMEAAKRENVMRTGMEKYIAQMEEERARQRREMEERESERKREMSRYIAQVEEERVKERKDKEEMFWEIQAKIASVANQSSEKLMKAAGEELTDFYLLTAARTQTEPSVTGNDLPVNSERRKRGFFRRLFGKRKGKKS